MSSEPLPSGVTLAELCQSHRILVTVGAGGVGKTTTAAAIAVHSAMTGARALVLTVDPARRLANSLGLREFEHHEQRISPALFAAAGLQPRGTLDAMMLDTKTTFDRVVQRYAPTAEVRDRILQNSFYLQASTALAGSHEYMAMEKLYEINEEQGANYDLIVLDTPPSRHALDFFSAPDRLSDLLDSTAFRLFLRSARTLGKLGLSGLRRDGLIFRGVGRFIGASVFVDILMFLESFSSMYDGFQQRAAHVKNLLRSDQVAFIVVTGTDDASVDEGQYFLAQLEAEHMPYGAWIVNRVHLPYIPDPCEEPDAAQLCERMMMEPALRLYRKSSVESVCRKIVEHHRRYRLLVRRDRRQLSGMAPAGAGTHLVPIPHFTEDVHDLAALDRFSRILFAASHASRAPGDGQPATSDPAESARRQRT